MNAKPEYPAFDRQITDAELLAALLPDTAAGAEPPTTTTPAPAPAAPPALDVAALLELARRQGALEATVQAQAAQPAARAEDKLSSGPLVPRWAVGTAVAGVGLGAGALLLGWAVDLLVAGAAAVAAGIAAAAPMLIIGAVLVAALLGRRKRDGGGFEVTQTVVQTITNTVRSTGGRR
ncbi:hypothetical protein ACI2LJ_37555 [Streptomyces sp. NPDC088090]|uniref:hypothetical protein n=1 Tax=Streptomyces sp. NPDC088090 TaxID=3365822 RepID=UPI00384BAD1B